MPNTNTLVFSILFLVLSPIIRECSTLILESDHHLSSTSSITISPILELSSSSTPSSSTANSVHAEEELTAAGETRTNSFSIECGNETKISENTHEELEEKCSTLNGTFGEGNFHFKTHEFSELKIVRDTDESWKSFPVAEQTEGLNINPTDKSQKINSRQKRFKRNDDSSTTALGDEENVKLECVVCLSKDNQILFAELIKDSTSNNDNPNPTPNKCAEGIKNCRTKGNIKPNIVYEILVTGFVVFLLCITCLAILSCRPVIFDGYYVPVSHFPCSGERKPRNLTKVRYSHQAGAGDENGYTIVDFDFE